jgi:hypothetical protein
MVASIIIIVGAVGLFGLRVMGSAFDTAMDESMPLAEPLPKNILALEIYKKHRR